MPSKDKLKILDIITIILVAVAMGMVFFYAPIERVMGYVQKCSISMWPAPGWEW